MVEAVCVPAHLAPPGSLQAKQLCYLQAQFSLGQSCCRQKKVLQGSNQGRFHSVRLFAALWTVACQASLSGKGILQARNLECVGQYWLPYPSRALNFLLPWPPTPLSTWYCQNPCDPSIACIPGPHRDKPKSSRAASGADPMDDPHAEVEIKPQLKPRGSVAKDEDPKPSHQLYKLQIKSTRSTRETLCLWNV